MSRYERSGTRTSGRGSELSSCIELRRSGVEEEAGPARVEGEIEADGWGADRQGDEELCPVGEVALAKRGER